MILEQIDNKLDVLIVHVPQREICHVEHNGHCFHRITKKLSTSFHGENRQSFGRLEWKLRSDVFFHRNIIYRSIRLIETDVTRFACGHFVVRQTEFAFSQNSFNVGL